MRADVDTVVAALLDAAGIEPSPPVDVLGLARALGVDTIELADLVEDGNVRHDEGGTHILVSKHINRARRRFTLAHELAHLVIAEPGDAFLAERSLPVRSDEERLCDEIAASILMPRAWVSCTFVDRPRTLASARELSDTALTSLAASVVRLNEVLGWRRTFLRWRRRGGEWRLCARAGTPPDLHGTITSSPGTRAVLDAQLGCGGEERFAELPIALAGHDHLAPAFFEVHRESALALVDLTGVRYG
jgi:hypothetical protein